MDEYLPTLYVKLTKIIGLNLYLLFRVCPVYLYYELSRWNLNLNIVLCIVYELGLAKVISFSQVIEAKELLEIIKQ